MGDDPQKMSPTEGSSPMHQRLESSVHIYVSKSENVGCRVHSNRSCNQKGQSEGGGAAADCPSPPKHPCPTANRDTRGECCDVCDSCKGHGNKGNNCEDDSDNFNICQSQDSLAVTLQMLKEELKNKPDELMVQFDLCNCMVICKDGKGLTSVVQRDNGGNIGSLVKYVPAISEWDDLDEYREYIRHNLGLGGKKESNQGAMPISIPQLDPGLPEIQEDYVKMMQ